jgi:hypothetical protein
MSTFEVSGIGRAIAKGNDRTKEASDIHKP